MALVRATRRLPFGNCQPEAVNAIPLDIDKYAYNTELHRDKQYQKLLKDAFNEDLVVFTLARSLRPLGHMYL